MAANPVKTRTGNLIVVSLGGIEYALIKSLHVQEDFAREPLQGAGEVKVIEWVPTSARYTLTADWMVMPNGINRGRVIPENVEATLSQKLFDIIIFERYPDPENPGSIPATWPKRELRKYIDCSYNSGSVSIDAHRIVVSNAVFHALDASGEGL